MLWFVQVIRSPTWMRIQALEQAAEKGIKIWAFLGPFMPWLSDTDEALDSLFSSIKHLPLSHAYCDKLNPKPGVWNEVAPFVKKRHPELLEKYRRHFFDAQAFEEYCEDLRNRALIIADVHGMRDVVMIGGSRENS
jgi:DNA repair photolyase